MRYVSLLAAAKINLYLEILGDRPDGYHELAMIMQSIDLADKLEVRTSRTQIIRVYCQHPEVPKDQTNLAYKAAQLMAKKFPDAFAQYGVEISLQKNIPVAAGLAGGSSNGAAVLVGLDLVWNLGLTQSQLQQLGAELGSDVPFCISGGTVIATGRGEKLAPLSDLDHLYLVLAKYKNLSISTAWAYQAYREKFDNTYITDTVILEQRKKQLNSGGLVKAIAHKEGGQIGKLLYNDLERVILPAYPQVAKLKDEFIKCNPLGAMMSGSGPTVFALAESKTQAEEIQEKVKTKIADPDLQFWIAKLNSTGMKIIQH